MATWNDVQKIVASLPETVEESAYGSRAWRVKKKLVVWERPLRRSDIEALGDRAPTGPILGARTASLELKEMLIARDPAVYFTTPHFDGYPAILVRLPKISVKELRGLIVEAWLDRAPKRLADAYLAQR
jgi:hypothetical protein